MTWQEIIQCYPIKYYNQIAKASQPLQNYFDITCLDYLKIYNDGRFVYLTNRPDCAEYYASEQLFRIDPYFRHPDTHQAGFFWLRINSSDDFKNYTCKISRQFNIHSPLVFSEKGSNYVEIFCFSGEKEETLHILYLKHSKLLRLFATHYKKELCLLLNKMEEESFSLVDLQGKAFYAGLDQSPAINTESLHAYLIALGKKEEIKKAASLSQRERDCLRLLIRGNSAKDSALELHHSPRTVEFYLENVKNKLGCSNKHELFVIAGDFENLGLL
ncbi:MAG: hypothetical protein HW387_771 [Parachlamydiales bacterium]|nr:hypothetical protein [Parachlamydiales bacterium]